ncbi:hypothetical protein OSB04_001333 [Centaurea solstitialis]|uniref:Integrase zinc-binding domain-containing protein n=1 Tax=Centaurea solstitialis TaxID=347529 RepID=A0AA38WLC1_9ASTR|nr:hypothetical protein OSB04_001333 [Centaurea solstitialis]
MTYSDSGNVNSRLGLNTIPTRGLLVSQLGKTSTRLGKPFRLQLGNRIPDSGDMNLDLGNINPDSGNGLGSVVCPTVRDSSGGKIIPLAGIARVVFLLVERTKLMVDALKKIELLDRASRRRVSTPYQGRVNLKFNVKSEHMVGYDQYLTEDNRGLKVFRDRVWIPKLGGIQDLVLSKEHKSRMSVHPGRTKIYYDLKSEYWWPGMKHDIARFVEQCLNLMATFNLLIYTDVEMGETYNGFGNKASKTNRQHDNIWVSPWKGILRFVKQGKLSPHFVGPFKIIERIGKQAYRLELPEELSGIHNVFHVGYLRKCLVPLAEVKIDERLRYIDEPE